MKVPVRTEAASSAARSVGDQTGAKSGGRYRLLLVSSHPVPYAEPLFGLMACHPKLDVSVVHCTVGAVYDTEFRCTINASASVSHSYTQLHVPNLAVKPGVGGFFGLANVGLGRLIAKGHFDAVAVFGYAYLSFWIAFAAAICARTPLFIGTDATELKHPSGGWWWKRWIKLPFVRFIYTRLADLVLVPSTASLQFLRRLGASEDRIVLTPFVVNNDYFARRVTALTREQMRDRLGIPNESFVVLYCGKLAPWKRPGDLLHAFASLIRSDPKMARSARLLFAGDGALRSSLESEVRSLDLAGQVQFLGFTPYDDLPSVYAASDLVVLPSEHETWGVVVNEAMACGVAVAVSDRVGARLDLVVPGETGEIFPCGDVGTLTRILQECMRNPTRTQSMADAGRRKIASWSYSENLEAWVSACEKIHKSGGLSLASDARSGLGCEQRGSETSRPRPVAPVPE